MKEQNDVISQKMRTRYKSYEKSILPDISKNNVNLNIGVTNACNCDCIFCFSKLLPHKITNIDRQLMFRLLDEGAELGITEFNPFGNYGDPFLCTDIFDYVKYAKSKGYTYVFTNTNGILLTPETGKQAIESGFDSIKISINAGTKETYAKIHGVHENVFDQVLTNLQALHQTRQMLSSSLIVSVSFVEFELNKHEKELLKDLVSPYVDDFIVLEMINPRNAFSDLAILNGGTGLDTLSEHSINGCNRPFNSIFITQEGYMNVCGMDEGGFGLVADLNKMSLKEAWECATIQQVRQKHIDGDLKGTVCGNCIQCRKDTILPFNKVFAHKVSAQSYSRELEIKKRGLL